MCQNSKQYAREKIKTKWAWGDIQIKKSKLRNEMCLKINSIETNKKKKREKQRRSRKLLIRQSKKYFKILDAFFSCWRLWCVFVVSNFHFNFSVAGEIQRSS